MDRLPVLSPDEQRAERVRLKCHAQLGRSRRRAARTGAVADFGWRVLAPVLVGAFCILYVSALVTTAVGFHNEFR